MAANFLADLFASGNASADPALDAADIADARRRDLTTAVDVARGALALAIRDHGYGRRSDAAAAHLSTLRGRLASL